MEMCVYLLEVPQQDASNENPQNTFSWRNKKTGVWIPPLICSCVINCLLMPKNAFSLNTVILLLFCCQLKKEFGSDSLPPFPPKKLLPLSTQKVDERRLMLERYIQTGTVNVFQTLYSILFFLFKLFFFSFINMQLFLKILGRMQTE